MDKRGILLVFLLVILLGVFFQFSRMDGFLHLYPLKNLTMLPQQGFQGDEVSLAREKYLILYDPQDVSSVFARHRLEDMLQRQKKEAVSESIYDSEITVDSEYRGVLLATGTLDRVACLPAVRHYVAEGGTAAVLMRPEADAGTLEPSLLQELGMAELGGSTNVLGIHLQTDFLFGGKGFSFGGRTVGEDATYNTNCSAVRLREDATLHVSAENGMPLLWEHASGQGKFFVYNGVVRDDKTNSGLLTAILAHCGEDGIYPILGTKVFFIDDFPSPVPEGNEPKIYEELHLTTEDFYRDRWWPYMRELAETYDLKYTGLIIESYGNQVTGPFYPTQGRRARDSLIVYGRELLDMGGELGIHGYNHQPLAPVGYNQDALDYVPWESQQDMIEALQELRRYVKEAYPDYELKAYVPPSDILSPEGREAVCKVFPEVRVFSSLYDGLASDRAYITDYERHDDGTYEIPRTTAGYVPSRQNMYEQISLMNYIGNFAHFVHPDELFYEESQDLSWAEMEKGLREFLDEFTARYGWLRPVTDSECVDYLADYFDMDYRVQRDTDSMRITCWNYRHPLRFILRTTKEIRQADGAEFIRVGDDTYMIETTAPQAEIYWKEGE